MYCNPSDVLNDGTKITDLAFENGLQTGIRDSKVG